MKTLQELCNSNEIRNIGNDIYYTPNINIIDKINIENLLMIKSEENNEITSIMLKEELSLVSSTINYIASHCKDLDKLNNSVKEILLKYNIYDNCSIYYSQYYNKLFIMKKCNNLINNIKDIVSNNHNMLIIFYKDNYVLFEIILKNNDYDKLENIISKINDN